ncbi:MAG: hypothetical protein M1838_005888, partial [Thelocarpon superellum]
MPSQPITTTIANHLDRNGTCDIGGALEFCIGAVVEAKLLLMDEESARPAVGATRPEAFLPDAGVGVSWLVAMLAIAADAMGSMVAEKVTGAKAARSDVLAVVDVDEVSPAVTDVLETDADGSGALSGHARAEASI